MNQIATQTVASPNSRSNTYTIRYALLGAGFGLLFPIIATLIALNQSGMPFRMANIFELHLTTPLLLIIDTAPLFLGFFAGLAGWREDRLQESNRRLEELVNSLEERVTDRTRDLDRAVEVGHGVTQVTDLDQMLAQAAELIRSSFELYYVQVYLLDETKRSLLLRAGTGLAGNALLNQRHRINLGLGTIVGTAAIEKQTIVIANTSASQLYQPNPLLPDTWSEMAMPLVVADNVIGVLDLQSDKPGQLSEGSLPALEAVAGQLAIAVEHARLVTEATEARSDIEEQARRMAHQGWQDFLNAIDRSEFIGYSYESNAIRSLPRALPDTQDENTLAVPIVITGEQVGSIQVQGSSTKPLSRYEAELAAAIAEQVGRQVENLRLLAEADHYRVEAEEATRRLTREGWQHFLDTPENQGTGFEYISGNVRRLSEFKGAIFENETLAKTLKVRGESIGFLEVVDDADYDEDTAELVAAVAEQLSTHLETLRLAESTERALADTGEQARRLAALNVLSQALSSANSLDDVYRVTAAHTRIIVPSDRISIALLGEDGNYFEILALHSERGATKVGDVFSGKGNVLSSAIMQNRVITINRNSEGGLPGIESFMVAPLNAGGRTFGTFNVGSNQPDAFDNRDETLLLQIASLLASTLETRRLFTETVRRAEELAVISRMARSRAEELSVLNEMGKALTSLSDEASVIRIVQHHTAHLMEAEGFYIALYDPEEDEVAITVFGEGEGAGSSTIRRRSGNGITEHIIRTRQPLLIRDNVPKVVRSLGIEAFGQMARSWLGVPMVVGDNIIGVVAVQSFETEGVYDEHHLDLLTAVANQAAIALENARLFHQVEDRARRERILREITARVRGSADVDSVMRTAAQELGRALGRQTYVYLGENASEEGGDQGKES